eukprot:scaffold37206_cov69-Phaeocystis_antarctica.AAC.2
MDGWRRPRPTIWAWGRVHTTKRWLSRARGALRSPTGTLLRLTIAQREVDTGGGPQHGAPSLGGIDRVGQAARRVAK